MPVLTYGQQSTLTSFQQWLMQQGVANCVIREQKGISPPPPGGVLATNGDTLRFVLASSDGAHAIDIAGQAFPQQGGYSRIYQQITTNSDTSFKYVTQAAIDGYYGNFVASVPQGQTIAAPGVYVRAELARTIGGTLVPYAILFEGYVHTKQTVNMNGGGQTTSGGGGDGTTTTGGTGSSCVCPSTYEIQDLDGVTAPSGFQVNRTPAANTVERIVTMNMYAEMGATVANRYFFFENVVVGTGPVFYQRTAQDIAASQNWTFQVNIEEAADHDEADVRYAAIPGDLWYSTEYQMQCGIGNFKAGDNVVSAYAIIEVKA